MTDDFDPDTFAAEYVLGTLAREERDAVETARVRDSRLDAAIRAWESRLSPLLELGAEAEPPVWVIDSVLAEITRKSPTPFADVGNVVALRRQVVVWRSATAAVAALAAALAIWIATTRLQPIDPASGVYMAALEEGGNAPAFLVTVDVGRHRMTVVPAAAKHQAGKSYELWMIGADNTPRSLGLLDTAAAAHPALPAADAGMISTAVYAVTLEADGGSQTGKPSSAPVFAGHLIAAPR